MITDAIIILIAILFGWFLRDLTIPRIKEKIEEVKKKILPNKSGMVDWTPPKSEEEIAEEKVKKGLKL